MPSNQEHGLARCTSDEALVPMLEAMDELGVTQRELGDALGYSQSYMSRILSGEFEPPYRVLRHLYLHTTGQRRMRLQLVLTGPPARDLPESRCTWIHTDHHDDELADRLKRKRLQRGEAASRLAHNQEVAGSNPAAAIDDSGVEMRR